jgi:hypothetical protein
MGRRSGLVLISLVLAVAGCGGKAPAGGRASPPGTTGTTTTDGPASATPRPDPGTTLARTGKPKPRNVIAWLISLGPGSPPGPVTSREVSVYNALQSMQCRTKAPQTVDGLDSELQGDSFDLYVGAVAACMAAFHGGRNWSTAERALADAPLGDNCFDSTVRGLLENLVRLHRENPTLPFAVATGGARPRSPCPDVTQVNPSRIVPGQEITVSGRGLNLVTGVSVSRENWDPLQSDLDFATDSGKIHVTMPDLSTNDITRSTRVRVAVEYNGSPIDSGLVTYEPAAGSSTGAGS